jgi:hypothetical protein
MLARQDVLDFGQTIYLLGALICIFVVASADPTLIV